MPAKSQDSSVIDYGLKARDSGPGRDKNFLFSTVSRRISNVLRILLFIMNLQLFHGTKLPESITSINLRLVRRLGMRGALPQFLHNSSWLSA
jgi:hypothetical protein